MSRFYSYLSSAVKIIETHGVGEPLTHHLKRFFSSDKKYGSNDRKILSALSYNYYRLGKSIKNEPVERKILSGVFLTTNKKNDLLDFLSPDLGSRVELPLEDKLSILKLSPEDIFPYTDVVSETINKINFSFSVLKQPHLFLRIRPGFQQTVSNKLTAAGILYRLSGDDCIILENGTPIDKLLSPDTEVVVQDFNSQKVFNHLDPQIFNGKISVWDCCAASGGKSILLYDLLKGKIELTVSDIRQNILLNLGTRFEKAGIKLKKKFKADLSIEVYGNEKFDIIICDAPCTGSGTWARTPEQISFFDPGTIETYVYRQKQIVQNVTRNLSKGGLFFYITCSIFRKENEDMVDFIQEKCNLSLLEMRYLKGYEMQADTLFVAEFTS